IEKRQQPMMENVGEAPERRVVEVELAAVRVLREMQRQRAVRAEEAEEIAREPRRARAVAGLECIDRRRRELERRRLTEPHALFGGPRGLAETRVVRVQRVDEANGREKAVALGLGLESAQALYNVCSCPRRGGHRMTWPRSVERSVVSVKELIET